MRESYSSYAQTLGRWAAELTLPALEDEIVAAAKAALIDTLGVAIAGSRFNPTLKAPQIHAAGVSARNDPVQGDSAGFQGDATVLGGAGLAGGMAFRPLREAAFLNGVSAHVLDFDDTCFAGILHGSAVILPAVLAAAQSRQADGKTLLEGFTAGSEVAYALGASYGDSLFAAGWFPSALLGAIGAAAGAAKVLGADSEATTRAIALAACNSAGIRAVLGSDAKPLMIGLAARQALDCAFLALQDHSFPSDVFEGRNGFFQLLRGESVPQPQIPGDPFRLCDPGLVVKRYPLCSSSQPALAALREILAAQDIAATAVAEISCRATPMALACLPYDRPENAAQARFCLPFALAAALCTGGPRPRDFEEASWHRPEIRALMSKVSLQEDDSGILATRGHEAAEVYLRLVDGRSFSACRAVAEGDPRDPLPAPVLAAKFRSNTDALLGESGSRRLLELLNRLESLRDLGEFSSLAAGFDAKISSS